MKVIAINGSPRKKGNTSTLLEKALEGAASLGAETKLTHLCDLNYKGCCSCFSCKKKNCKAIGSCVMQDDLTEVLGDILESKVLLLGSPIYLGNITGAMKAFLERLIFSNLSYDSESRTNFMGVLQTGFIYTMGLPHNKIGSFGYQYLFDTNRSYLQLLNGESEYLVSADNYQFDDYSKYAASNFDEHLKAEIRKMQFPVDCQKAFEMGAKLFSIAGNTVFSGEAKDDKN